MSKLFYIFLFFISSLSATIYEAASIEELTPYLTENTLVITGFDNTIVESKEPLGSKPWRGWIRNAIKELENEQLIPNILLAKHVTNLGRFAVPLQAIEGEKTFEFFKQLQIRNIPYLLITARSKDFMDTVPNGFAKSSLRQLKKSGIVIPSIAKLECYLWEGFLFAKEHAKGQSLKELFENSQYFPKRLLFFDNNLQDIASVQSAMQELGIEFFGFHFIQEKKSFDPLIANIQFEVFLNENRVPSIEEALQLKQSLRSQDANSHFKSLILNSYPKIVEKSFSAMRSL